MNFAIIKNILKNPKAFFLENLGVRQTIFKNTLWLATAEGITRFLKLILIIYIARILGASDYGKFTFALSFVSLFVILSDFGLPQIVTREFSRDRKKEKDFSSLISLKIFLSLSTLALILIGSFFITPDPLIQRLIWILAVFVIVENFGMLFFAFFQARQKMEYQALTKILEAILVTGVGFFILFYFPSVLNLSLGYLFSAFFALIFILIIFHFKVFSLKISFEKKIWQNFLSLSWPLALGGIFGAIYWHTDSTMMGYWGQIAQTGWYNAALRITQATLIPAALISQSFFPALSLAFQESKERLQKIWNYQMEAMIFLAIPLAVGGIALAPKIIDWLYDPNFFPSILAFQILIIASSFIFLNQAFSQALIVANQQKKAFWIAFAGALTNVILNLILIPKYSLYGAAFASLVTLFLIFFLYLQFTSRFTPINPYNLKLLSTFFGATLSSAAMYFILIQPPIYSRHILISVLTGATIYPICFLGYKKIVNEILSYLRGD